MLRENVDKQPLSGPLSSEMLSGRDGLKHINGRLSIEQDGAVFYVDACDDIAIIHCSNFMTMLLNLRKLKHAFHLRSERLNEVNQMLCAMGITICLQYRHLGILGLKTSAVMRKLFFSAVS